MNKPKHGHFFWNELSTRDVAKAKAFYADTLGWTYSEMDMGPNGIYYVAMDGDEPVGGMFEMAGSDFEGVPEHWMSYIAIADIDANVEKAKAAGATVQMEPFDIPEVGRMAVLTQPDGATISWMQPSDGVDS